MFNMEINIVYFVVYSKTATRDKLFQVIEHYMVTIIIFFLK
jgi:hypothetical protein